MYDPARFDKNSIKKRLEKGVYPSCETQEKKENKTDKKM
jgi:hypothetical protein